MEMEWVKYVVAILTGLATAIPLVVKLVKYVQLAIKEKNWDKLLELIMNLMKQAEENFSEGSTRKEWVMDMIQASSGSINYDINMGTVSALIDSLCGLSKIVNVSAELSVEKTGV